MKIELAVRHQGHPPSFKNNKRSVIRNGKAFPVTDKKTKKWMDRCIQSFESQLFCAYQTEGAGMQMGHCRQFLTALLRQSKDFDDNIDWIPEIHVTVERVKPGEEGAHITLDELQS